MKLLILVAMLAARAASVKDLSGKMFVFPAQNNIARVKLNPTKTGFSVATVCHRSFTDLRRHHSLFSLATSQMANAFLVFWDNANSELEAHIRDQKTEYRSFDYKINMWHSICTTWNSETGLVQMWFNGVPSIIKSGPTTPISGNVIILLGQEQDSHGGGFDSTQSFVGMMADVNMWDYVLSSCEIQRYADGGQYNPGNVLNWRALDYTITDKVLVEDRITVCE